jgi:glycine cleavage system H protein
VYAPITGKVTEVNEALTDDPGMVNTNAEDDAWFIKMEIADKSELEGLMSGEQYKDHCEKEAH